MAQLNFYDRECRLFEGSHSGIFSKIKTTVSNLNPNQNNSNMIAQEFYRQDQFRFHPKSLQISAEGSAAIFQNLQKNLDSKEDSAKA